MLWEAVRIISFLKPKIIIFENVLGILSSKNQAVFEKYNKTLAEQGYSNSDAIKLNLLDFGIPQHRKRVFVISLLNEYSNNNNKKILSNIQIWIDEYKKEKFLKRPNLKHFLKINNFSQREKISKKIEYYYTNFCTWKDGKGNKNGSYNRAWKIEKYCGTLSVSNIMRITDGKEVSVITPAESFQLMGFDAEDYQVLKKEFPSNNFLRTLAGNSIGVPILICILKFLQKNKLV